MNPSIDRNLRQRLGDALARADRALNDAKAGGRNRSDVAHSTVVAPATA